MPVVVKADWKQMDYFKVKAILGDMFPLFSAIGIEVLKEVGRNFAAEGIWSKWAPLRPNTLAGRRQGSTSKALQASGRLRASFRMEPLKSQVRVGSPLRIAEFHHEGRGVAVGGAKWKIVPKHGKALAFPVAAGGESLRRMGQKRGMSVGMIRGKLIQVAYNAGLGAPSKVVKFKTYAYHKRSRSFMSGIPMAVLRSVMHPGYPPRPMLPPETVAGAIVEAVAKKFIENVKGVG